MRKALTPDASLGMLASGLAPARTDLRILFSGETALVIAETSSAQRIAESAAMRLIVDIPNPHVAFFFAEEKFFHL
jgi:hypothetical protein